MPTKRPRLMLTLDPADEKVLDALDKELANMSRAGIGLAALRLGLVQLRDDPSLAARVGPVPAEESKARRKT